MGSLVADYSTGVGAPGTNAGTFVTVWFFNISARSVHIFCDPTVFTLSASKRLAMSDFEAEKTRIVIADDHAILRDSLALLLATQPDFEVQGTAANGQEALEMVQQHHPDVLVLDLFMPNFDGFEVLRTLDRTGNRVATVVLTASDSDTDYAQVVRLGARGLVMKGDGPQSLFDAIRMVSAGELAFSDELARQVVNTLAHDSSSYGPRQGSLHRLSDRERQIAHAVARGMKNRDIAGQLNISENTVKRHLQSIFGKTGARDRLELAVLALNEASKAA